MKIDTSKNMVAPLRAMSRKDLNKLAAHVNAEINQREREVEHFAHLSRTSDDPNCKICRKTAALRRDT